MIVLTFFVMLLLAYQLGKTVMRCGARNVGAKEKGKEQRMVVWLNS